MRGLAEDARGQGSATWGQVGEVDVPEGTLRLILSKRFTKEFGNPGGDTAPIDIKITNEVM
jgi:hypothetical protein